MLKLLVGKNKNLWERIKSLRTSTLFLTLERNPIALMLSKMYSANTLLVLSTYLTGNVLSSHKQILYKIERCLEHHYSHYGVE